MKTRTIARLAVAAVILTAFAATQAVAKKRAERRRVRGHILSVDRDANQLVVKSREGEELTLTFSPKRYMYFRNVVDRDGLDIDGPVYVVGKVDEDAGKVEARIVECLKRKHGARIDEKRVYGILRKDDDKLYVQADDKRFEVVTNKNTNLVVRAEAGPEDLVEGAFINSRAVVRGDDLILLDIQIVPPKTE